MELEGRCIWLSKSLSLSIQCLIPHGYTCVTHTHTRISAQAHWTSLHSHSLPQPRALQNTQVSATHSNTETDVEPVIFMTASMSIITQHVSTAAIKRSETITSAVSSAHQCVNVDLSHFFFNSNTVLFMTRSWQMSVTPLEYTHCCGRIWFVCALTLKRARI